MLLEMQEKTGIVPQALQNRPTLIRAVLPYWDMFWILTKGRGNGLNGPDPIKVSEILELLCQGYGEEDKDERFKCIRVIQAMDQTYNEVAAAKAAAREKAKK